MYVKTSYLERNIAQYNISSYLDEEEDSDNMHSYIMDAGSEADIFSNLPKELFSSKNEQISNVLNRFKEMFYHIIGENEITSVLPKLQCIEDEDSAVIIQLLSTWSGGNSTLYFSFESNEKDSSYGIIWNDNSKNDYLSKSSLLINRDIDDIIREVIDYLLRLY